MHAGEAKNGRGQRAHGDKFYAPTGEAIMPAGKLNEKCTPARLRTGGAQRALRDKFYAPTGEAIMPAGKLNKKCTPVR